MSATTEAVKKKFTEMGAKVNISRSDKARSPISINILNGEFVINTDLETEVQVVDFNKKDRHLLLLASIPNTSRRGLSNDKQRYLCGHDERDWFTCAIPNVVKNIIEAKEALKPEELKSVERGTVKPKDKQKRHRKAKGLGKIHRQGEFMFIPMPDWKPGKNMFILKNEPMRAGGRPHVAREVVRTGGRTVYTLGRRVMEAEQYESLQKSQPKEASRWRAEKADPTVYAKGTIRHPDHKTLDLGDVWHKVLVNTEKNATFARNVLFID